MDIWVMRADGTGEFQVTRTDDWQEGAPFFLPDNEHIIFRAWRRSEYKKIRPTPMTVFTIKRDGSDWRRHTHDNGMNWHPVVTPDGRHYVYVKAVIATNWEIFLGDLAGGEHRQLTFDERLDILAHVSPDGKKMNWGRSTGPGFMQGIRTFVGREHYARSIRRGANPCGTTHPRPRPPHSARSSTPHRWRTARMSAYCSMFSARSAPGFRIHPRAANSADRCR